MEPPSASRDALESLWRERTRIAYESYLQARANTQRAEELRIDAPPADGFLAIHQAIRAENESLRKYGRVLSAFTDLIIHGTIPDDAEWRR
jgi:hypothetical protein